MEEGKERERRERDRFLEKNTGKGKHQWAG